MEKPDNGKAIRTSALSDALATPKTQAPGVGSGGRARILDERGRLMRDCAHQQSHHEHGTRKAYVLDRCRCESCTAANRFEAQRRRKAIAYGRWQGLVPAGAAREHVQQLRSVGTSLQRIATLSGVGYGTVARLAYGNASSRQPPTERLRHDTEQRLLNLRAGAGTVPPGARVEATGSRRRLQALVAAGWPLRTLAQRLGRSPGNLRRTMKANLITDACARRISRTYTELHNVPPPGHTAVERARASHARATAREFGWLPPWAWDDIDGDRDDLAIEEDELEGSLDEIAIEQAIRGESVQLTRAERDEVITRLTNRGLSARRIAYLIGTTSRNVVRRRAAQRAA